jgi:DNA gyrase subunit A
MGRNTQGVRLISLTKDEKLVGIERIVEDNDDAADEAGDD